MKRVCAWCKKEMGRKPSAVHGDDVITHGICEECQYHLCAQVGMPLRRFLDGLSAPVLLVDSGGIVRTANQSAQGLVRKKLSSIEGYRGGSVFECGYAILPGGCGATVPCSGCTVRKAVMDPYESGRSLFRVPAYLNRKTSDGSQKLRFLISTEKVREVVLLRIDEVAMEGDGQFMPEKR
jgi:hypothetical protein